MIPRSIMVHDIFALTFKLNATVSFRNECLLDQQVNHGPERNVECWFSHTNRFPEFSYFIPGESIKMPGV